MRIWLTALAFVSTVALGQSVPIPDQSQGNGPSIESPGELPLTYVGANDRVSIGIDKDGNTQGELMGVFARNDERAVIAQVWWLHGGAGGFQTDYNWLWGVSTAEARMHPDAMTVAKLSFGMNQDEEQNRQAAVAFAIERKQFFVDAYVAAKASRAHDAGALNSTLQTIQNGTDAIGNFTQTIDTTTTTQLRSQPYSYSVGVHGGHFSDPLAARFNVGADYDKGNDGAYETRASIGIDKYIGTRGWSVSALAEHANQKDPLLGNHSDNRVWLMLRYEFGGTGAFVKNDQVGDSAWISRALGEPVVTTPHALRTYVSRGKSTTVTKPGTKQYTAHRPVAQNDAAIVPENSSNNPINVLANDVDADGNPLSITAVAQPAHGAAQIAGAQINYTPTAGYAGNDAFTYTISDNKGLTAMASVNVTVAGSAPPVARDYTESTPYGMPVTVNVLTNDSDPSGYPLTISSVGQPAHGTAQIGGNAIVYTPQPTYYGDDTFAYTINNGHGGAATGQVMVTVQPPRAPTAIRDTATTPYNTPVTILPLANDSDPNGLPLHLVSVSNPKDGTAQISGDQVIYTPSATFNGGQDSFTYVVSDNKGIAATGPIVVTVQPPGTPAANNDTATTAYNTSVTVNVLANDTDPNGLPLSIASVTAPSHGTAQISNIQILYTPQSSFFGGTDSFSYTIGDGHGGTATATVTVTVAAPLPPTAANYTTTLQPVTVVGIGFFRFLEATVNVLANDSDPNGFPLTVTSLGPAQYAMPVNNGDGTVSYKASGSSNFGNDAFTYTISNGHGGTATGTVTLLLPTLTVSTVVVNSGGTGTVAPPTATVTYGGMATFTLTPDAASDVAAASTDTCGGTRTDGTSSSTYVTAPVEETCTLTVTFGTAIP